jgi:metallo-beta-lactamase class B
MKLIFYSVTILFTSSIACGIIKTDPKLPQSNILTIEPLTASVFKHISYLNTESYGKVACNALVVISNREAIIIDCPTDDSGSQELINWIEKDKKCKI